MEQLEYNTENKKGKHLNYEDTGQQHLLFRGKEDIKQNGRIESSFKHQLLLANTPILSLSNKRKSSFSHNIHVKRRIVFFCEAE